MKSGTVFYQTAPKRGESAVLHAKVHSEKHVHVLLNVTNISGGKTVKPNFSWLWLFGENRSVYIFIGAIQRNFRVFCGFRNGGRSKSKQYVTDNTMSYIFK